MGLNRLKVSKQISPRLRRNINFFSSLGCAAVVGIAAGAHQLWGLYGHEVEDERRLQSMYPKDLVLEEPYFYEPVGKKFASLLHVIGILYMLLGLNTVCDVYFAGSIDKLVDAWQMTADVAGATFMAAGGSAPELFTSLIGATIAMNDVGFGTIVGSAVFNVLFVIGLCGYVAKGNIDLTWWPLFRDCSYYIVSLAVLAAFTTDQYIKVWEAVILFSMYLGYITIMFFNGKLQAIAYGFQKSKSSTQVTHVKPVPTVHGIGSEDSTPQAVQDNYVEPEKVKAMEEDAKTEAGKSPDSANKSTDVEAAEETQGDGEDDDDEPEDFMIRPDTPGAMIIWALCLPVYIPLYYLIPWPSEKYYFVTFGVSLIWIAGFSFCLVWWTEIVGAVIGVPTILMGLTVLAAGTSIPDAVSSMAVARNGQADMAVSSSIGSNIFDILVGLPIPWIIKAGIIEHGNTSYPGVQILSPYLAFYVALLLFMVFAVVVSIHMNKWKLSKGLGVMMAALYLVFIVAAICVDVGQPQWLRTA
mmetsp:Transcript_90904/g.161820  ORF Transcript_90904/g.161820 Transcript_90904/m.161820 type:complete len:526 (-) Transcript_90904:153-1730(-)